MKPRAPALQAKATSMKALTVLRVTTLAVLTSSLLSGCAAIDRLRAERDSVLVVDMGWPSDDRAYADVATFGASRLVGRALIELLDRGPTEQAVEAP